MAAKAVLTSVSEAAISTAEAVHTLLTLADLAHRFGERRVFSPIEAVVAGGQVGIVHGPNGAGKSTLLRILAGLLSPTSGSATLTIAGKPQDALERRRYIGYVAPDLTLYRELSAAENLQFFARLHNIDLSRGDLIERLTEVGLRGRGRDLVGAYSSGMRQRLKYAFALLTLPPILFLDEPTANLDTDGVAMVERVLGRYRGQSGKIAIVATNEPREMDWGDLHILLEHDR